jgi:hypothetical protein
MALRRQDTAYDMSTANKHIITTVGCCSHKNHHDVVTHRHGQNLSRNTHTQSSEVTASNSETLARNGRRPWGSHSKAYFVMFLQRAFKFLRHLNESVALSDDHNTEHRIECMWYFLYILRAANDTAHSGHHNTSRKPVLKLDCFRHIMKCHILFRSLLLGITTSITPPIHLSGTRLTASLASRQQSPAQTARRVHIVLHIPARYQHL